MKQELLSDTRKRRRTSEKLHIHIDAKGDLYVWGLEQKSEERILALTGNHTLINKLKKMSYDLCG